MSPRNEATKKLKDKPVKRTSSKKGQPIEEEVFEDYEPLLDGGMRNDLIGIVLALVGIVLFVAVVLPSDAPATSAVASGLEHAFGLGAYIIPFAFVIWGASYFLKTTDAHVGRLIVGIVLIVVSLMGLLSLFNASADPAVPDSLFGELVLVRGGGYVGSALAWVLLSPFGQVIACIILIALIIAGLVLTGLSISVPFLFVKNLLTASREQRQVEDEVEASANFAKQERFSTDAIDDPAFAVEDDETVLYGNTKRSPLTHKLHKNEGDTVVFDEGGAADVDGTVVLGDESSKKSSKGRKKASKKGAGEATVVLAQAPGPTALEGFELPKMGILSVSGTRKNTSSGELSKTAELLQQTLGEFSVPAEVVGWLCGPTVTMFKVSLPSGVRLARLVNLADDIALSLAAPGVRIAQIPNTSLVGVEIPNKTRTNVLLGDIIREAGAGPLQMAIGEDVDGNKICLDLAKMPHLLVGGTTGSGKSIALNGMIMTILMRATPAEVRMILIDPKRVEFSLYNGIPHLLVPPVTEPKEAASALKWAVAEMERRLKVFEQVGARNIGFYNQMIQKGELDDEDGNHPDEIAYIVVVIDELSDLMMVAGKEVEDSIVRISQLARAAGIHLIVATQRPSANVVTGMIKANITNRIALTVSQGLESRVIIDQAGAEKLTGHGDMLFSRPEWGKPKRIQGCYVSEAEISTVVEHLKQQGEPDYHKEILQTQLSSDSGSGAHGGSGGGSEADDPLLWEAADAVVAAGLGSTSMLQRRLKVGYARAGRIMDMLEAKGIVGPQDGSRARDVLIDTVEDLAALRAFEEQDEESV